MLVFLALKVNQDDHHQLPTKVQNFVGREHVLNQSTALLRKDENFLIITGGPCYGKSSLANELGYAMFGKDYNYVIWINMRDISTETGSPNLEDIALKILQEFKIDTSEMKDDIVEYLSRKFECITANRKAALLIFDNADDLLDPKEDGTCKTSTYTKLCRLIRNNSRKSIRAIFTTRVCKDLESKEDQKIGIGPLSEAESRTFLLKELKEIKGLDRAALIEEFVLISHGLPYALTLISSTVNKMNGKKMVDDYVTDLKKTVSEDERLFNLFDLSIQRLKDDVKKLFSLLPVFPSRFSYSYVKKVSCHITSVALKPRMLKNLEEHSLVINDSRQNESADVVYLIHPFLREFMRERYWNESQRQMYEKAYYKTYTDQLFIVARTALQKDGYVDCLEEFRMEQQNFSNVMKEIGTGPDSENLSSHRRDVFKDVLNNRSTPDYIATLLFCCDIIHPSILVDFYEGSEAFVDGQLKKNVWCCRYDANMKYFEKQIDDPYKDLQPDEYGKALLGKRCISQEIHVSHVNKSIRGEFKQLIANIDEYQHTIQSLEDVAMKSYFKHKILKQKGTLQKRGYKAKIPYVDKNACVGSFKEALEICKEDYGKSWLTIDCYNQLGKLNWSFQERENAIEAFDKAIELAESMSLRNDKRFGSCLLDKGRFLIISGVEGLIEEGVSLLEDVLDRSNDFSVTRYWCIAMEFIFKVDKSRSEEIKNQFLNADKYNRFMADLMNEVINFDMKLPNEEFDKDRFLDKEKKKLNDLRKAIEHLGEIEKRERLSNTREADNTLLIESERQYLFLWNMLVATKFDHVLLESERKEFAEKAIEYMDICSSIKQDKRKELESIASSKNSPNRMEVILEKCFLDRIQKKMLEVGRKDELTQRYSKLLEKCENDQELWSSVVCTLSRNEPAFYERVTPYLQRQPKPCKDLLNLVSFKFIYQIRIYNRESAERVIMEESTKAVDDLKRAISYVERLLESDTLTSDEVIDRLQCCSKLWCKYIALDTDHCLLEGDRRKFAHRAACTTSLKEVERKKLMSLNSVPAVQQTLLEQEQTRKKSLLIKVTKFMRQNGFQDELETRYMRFLVECYPFPRIRFDMVQYITKNKNVVFSKYSGYLQHIVAHFQDGTIDREWHYQFIINVMHDLLSNGDLSTQRESVAICRSIFNCLVARKVRVSAEIKNKLEFEFRVILSVKVNNEIAPLWERKENARKALAIENSFGICRQYPNLSKYKDQLEILSAQ